MHFLLTKCYQLIGLINQCALVASFIQEKDFLKEEIWRNIDFPPERNSTKIHIFH